MTIEAQAAENLTKEVTKLTYKGMAAATKVSAEATKKILEKISANLNNPELSQSRPYYSRAQHRLINMLESGRDLSAIRIRDMDFFAFATGAKEYAVQYVVLKDEEDNDGTVDVIVYHDDLAKLQRMIDKSYIEPADIEKTYNPLVKVINGLPYSFINSYKSFNIEEDRSDFPFASEALKRLQCFEKSELYYNSINKMKRSSIRRKLRRMVAKEQQEIEINCPDTTLRRQAAKGFSGNVPIFNSSINGNPTMQQYQSQDQGQEPGATQSPQPQQMQSAQTIQGLLKAHGKLQRDGGERK